MSTNDTSKECNDKIRMCMPFFYCCYVFLLSSESNSFQENHSFLFNVSDRFALLFLYMRMCVCVFFFAFWAWVSVRPFSIEKIFSDRYAYLSEIGLVKC